LHAARRSHIRIVKWKSFFTQKTWIGGRSNGTIISLQSAAITAEQATQSSLYHHQPTKKSSQHTHLSKKASKDIFVVRPSQLQIESLVFATMIFLLH